MLKSAKLSAEEKFAALQKQEIQVKNEKDIEEQAKAEHKAKLRALRLSKEAADKKSALKEAAAKKSATKTAVKKPAKKAAR